MDFNINSTNKQPIISEEVECLIQELDVLFNTDPLDVFNGKDEFENIKYYVFSTKISNSDLEGKLRNLVNNTCNIPDNVNCDVNVSFIPGELSDIGVITVIIKDLRSENEILKTYSYS